MRLHAKVKRSNTDTGDGRRVQVAWMRDSDSGNMPFNQQISFPCELKLKNTAVGLRVFRSPIVEIASLHKETAAWSDLTLEAGKPLVLTTKGDLYHLVAHVHIPAGSRLTFNLRGVPITCTPQAVTCKASTGVAADAVKLLEILLDRGSVEA